MLGHDEVWHAIDALAEKNGLSPSGLARRSGLDPTTFNKSKRFAADGRPRWPSTESIAKILRATGTSIGELFGFASQAIDRTGDLSVPLIGEAHAGLELAPPSANDPIMLPRPPRIVSFPDRRHEPLFALSVVGDSMLPLYRNGDILFVSPTAPVRTGDRVVVKLRSSEVMVKVLKAQDDGTLAFHAVSPDHPDVAFPADAVEWMSRIVYATQ
jgi:phage repressor protein C with HTH and peptisase S24 domain